MKIEMMTREHILAVAEIEKEAFGAENAQKTLEKELDEWLDMNITESYIYQLKDNSSSDEINYFRYFEAIKQDVLKDFPEAPAAMIDALIDEHLNSLV